jgi:hypothetical protein
MSDGHEEREQQASRREQQKKENREDWVNRDLVDEWEPERRES